MRLQDIYKLWNQRREKVSDARTTQAEKEIFLPTSRPEEQAQQLAETALMLKLTIERMERCEDYVEQNNIIRQLSVNYITITKDLAKLTNSQPANRPQLYYF